MIIDFNQKVINILTGKVFINEDKTEITLKNVACVALFSNLQDEIIDGEEKLKRYDLGTRIIKNPKIELTAEEVVKIKELISKTYTTIIVGKVFEMIEGK
jgi:hypothetical protein